MADCEALDHRPNLMRKPILQSGHLVCNMIFSPTPKPNRQWTLSRLYKWNHAKSPKKSAETVTNCHESVLDHPDILVTVNDVELLFTEALFLWTEWDGSML